MYNKEYYVKRYYAIDRTEWYDILYSLKALGAKHTDIIFELGAGHGLLLGFLKRSGYKNVLGCDLLEVPHRNVFKCDLNKEVPPNADYYIFQHVIEHLNQNRVIELFRIFLHKKKCKAIIGIVPGHYTVDPTHVINHYRYEDLTDIIKKVKPMYWYIRYDSASFINPYSSDWLIILSNKPFSRLKTYPYFIYPLLIGRKLSRRLIKWKGI